MIRTGYFDTPKSEGGFVWRTHYTESGGVVSITNIQLQSNTYKGPAWFPLGQIAVNDVTILQMDYNDSATHAFTVEAASEAFIDIETLSGQALPVSSQRITTGKAEITVSMELYRSSDGTHSYNIEGSTVIDVASILAMVHDGEEFTQKQPVIKHDAGAKNYRPVVYNGAEWSK